MLRLEHEETRATLEALPESEEKQELLAAFQDSYRVTVKAEKDTRDALIRERAKLN